MPRPHQGHGRFPCDSCCLKPGGKKTLAKQPSGRQAQCLDRGLGCPSVHPGTNVCLHLKCNADKSVPDRL
uniref:Uncharacterized protein n=1 Tax=Myripristis murdjan TaxID=586833 RepID=A0A667Y557_9TELE